MQALQGKVAVVTGGSSGIGLATAKRFVAEGAFVFITGRRQAELDKAVRDIGQNVVAVKCDVSRLEDLDRLYQEVAGRKGKIDIVFANAGMVETVETPAVTPEHFDRTFDTSEHDACPDSGQLTQWTIDDHCTQKGTAQSNWNPNCTAPPLK
jgi:NAD(P)-dependent dehydrogenase (short-subunit alcohol dehydrogenase family)